jgi:hypothetical protein
VRNMVMERYKNVGGNSSVDSYETGPDFIRVRFKDGSQYLYTNISTGASSIEIMKKLGSNGSGLNEYISKVVKKRYACKER